MAGLTRDQVTYQVAQWAANDPGVLERARRILAGEPERHTDKGRADLLALFIGDLVYSNGNGYSHTLDEYPFPPFWDAEALQGLREVIDRHDFYVTGVDWDAVAEELKPE
ncbi:hypothetical protein [Streptomyces sp. 5-10]|uniref:hypothetical protein n=1 Tax=Streptomyces sp. 5-10 TaxID=878925 RepID=UPI00168A50E5|nr:hypothetical protein [Streptomyces sp. 5-10]MBD3004580.1 hypothetical protein [Streptomyces sp. 5-10]